MRTCKKRCTLQSTLRPLWAGLRPRHVCWEQLRYCSPTSICFLLCRPFPNQVINPFVKHCFFGERPAHRRWVSLIRSDLPIHTSPYFFPLFRGCFLRELRISVVSTLHSDARHAHGGRGSAQLMCVLYFSRPGPPNPHLSRSLQVNPQELGNFVTDIQTTDDRRQTTDEALYSK